MIKDKLQEGIQECQTQFQLTNQTIELLGEFS